MSKIYTANRPFGGLKTGEEVTGLTDERIKFLLENGVIVEAVANDTVKPTKADTEASAEPKAKPTKSDKETT